MSGIILTTDLSEESTRAFAPTIALAGKLGLKVVLLHVVLEHHAVPHGAMLAPPVTSPDVEPELEQAREKIAEMSAELSDGVSVAGEVISSEDVVRAITDYADREQADFIAISTHGRTGLKHLVLGSVAEGVLRHAKVPVMCFPQKGD